MKLQTLLASFCLFTSTSFAQQLQTIESLPKEKWWGGMVAAGSQMPFAENTKIIDLSTTNNNNQTSSLLLSSKGRYIYSEKPFAFQFKGGDIEIKSEQYIKATQAGKTLKEAHLSAMQFFFPPQKSMPDSIFFVVPQYNTWIELMYDQNQKDIMEYAANIKKHGFPEGIFMIDDNWQRYYGNFDFKAECFPDPKGMINQLHTDGFKVMLWISPFVSPDSPEYRLLRSKNYLIKKADSNEPAMIRWWNGYSACYDLTNPEAMEYLIDQLKFMQTEYGVDGFKFDAGDPELHKGNYNYFDKTATNVDFCQKWNELGLHFPFNEFRAAWNYGGQPLVQRLGDKNYSWGALSLLIPDMITAGLLGYSFTCPDLIGGGQFASFLNIDKNKFDQELIVRSAQIHAVMPMMQYSVAPWNILNTENLNLCKEANELHESFKGYIMQLANETANEGTPMVRHMEYEFPHQGMEQCKDQFMLGSKYLIAPFVKKEATRTVILPKGKWKYNGKNIKGGKTLTIDARPNLVPIFEQL